ncbi:MAG: EFR1 family ferrodoxin [Oscillospiraceae bacterium]
MIYYFSATGNSQWAASELAQLTSDNIASITDIMRDPPRDIPVQDVLGIVFPIHAYGPPRIVRDFVKLLRPEPSTYIYAVATCGSSTGYAFSMLEENFRFDAAYSICMPNNYIITYDVNSEALVKRKLRDAPKSLKRIAKGVNSRAHEELLSRGGLSRAQSYSYYDSYQREITDEPFYSESKCDSCGVCAQVCPLGNIKLKDGKPSWNGSCMLCMACINSCPVRAIQYGGFTQKKGRYLFSMVSHLLDK